MLLSTTTKKKPRSASTTGNDAAIARACVRLAHLPLQVPQELYERHNETLAPAQLPRGWRKLLRLRSGLWTDAPAEAPV